MDLTNKYHPEVLKISKQVLESGVKEDIQALFAVKENTTKPEIHYKFELFAQIFYNSYFTSDIETFHDSFIDNMIDSYFGRTRYVNLGFRGCGKTSFTKLFVVFMILNDRTQYRKYIKILTRNIGNAKQMVTDVYNMILEVKSVYGDPFVKEGDKKREETMGSFTTTDGRKLLSGTVGMTQRGHLQGAFRPDWIVFDDVEDRESISSLSTTEGTIFRIDEAIAGLSADGSWMALGNYISEEGVIQWFLNKPDIVVDKIAIMDEDGNPTWPEQYNKEKIEKLKGDSEDFYGEYMCDPSKADEAFFERIRVDNDLSACKQPHWESAGVRYWGNYIPHHAFGIGADTSEGIGKDANTMAVWDFGVHENDVATLVATYFNNNIAPDLFGHELMRVGAEFGNCIVAPEANNTGHATLATMRGYPNIYAQSDEASSRRVKYTEKLGWRTTRKTKPQMFFDFRKDYNDGLIKIYDKNVLKEMRSYTSMDLTDTKHGMVTRHFDLLMACFVKGTSILTDKGQKPIEDIKVGDIVMTRDGYKRVESTVSHVKEVVTNIGLTGTPDHPVFCNDNNIKDLSAVGSSDILYIWDSKQQKIEKLSYTEALPIIGTLTHHTETTGSTTAVEQSGRSQLNTYTERSGKITTDLYRKVTSCTTKTMTHLITPLRTSNSSLRANTCHSTWKNRNEKKNLGNSSKRIEEKSTMESERRSKGNQNESFLVSGAKKVSRQLRTTLGSVLGIVPGGRKEKRERKPSKRKHAQCAEDVTRQESHTKKDAQKSVSEQDGKKNHQTVYNLQVEGTPEYFANNVLVHNCVIGYQMRKHATINYFAEDVEMEDEMAFPDIGL